MIVCWSAKGGSGVTVTSTLLARAIAEQRATTLVDLGGDAPSVLGLDTEPQVGINHWLRASSGVMPDALQRLVVKLEDDLSLLPAGAAPIPRGDDVRVDHAAARLADELPEAVVDAGVCRSNDDMVAALVRHAEASVLVIRPCYLAMKRASRLGLTPTGIVVIDEPGRSLDARDIADVLGAPILAVLPWDAAVTRSVDAGRLRLDKTKTSKLVRRVAIELDRSDDGDVIRVA